MFTNPCRKSNFLFLPLIFSLATTLLRAQTIPGNDTGSSYASQVNVFLGTSGDHGQMSPAASYPFSMLSMGPQTYPHLHAGYEYNAKKFLGFTHTRFEGVGCMGSGGNIMVTPFLGKEPGSGELIKAKENAAPGFYSVAFSNKIKASLAVFEKRGMHRYEFPKGEKGFQINFSHTLANRFVAEEHTIEGRSISGWVDARTTCNAGTYRVYYYMEWSRNMGWEETAPHVITGRIGVEEERAELRIALSSVSVAYAKQETGKEDFLTLQQKSSEGWNKVLGRIAVEGDAPAKKLFYSLLYRTLQSPYVISEKDGQYKATNGNVQTGNDTLYNGWAIWDNYRTQLPLLSLVLPEKYRGMITSVANLYRSGKKAYATQQEPSNTVRTEHAIVVLLDAHRKGFPVPFREIADSLVAEVSALDYSSPDKALEACYDAWALAEILSGLGEQELARKFRAIAATYKNYWNRDFKDLTQPDVDKMQARGLYQGTIWQYRWFVPYDVKGLMELAGGEEQFLKELDTFFHKDYYNHANEPDLQVPALYNATAEPWKSQHLMRKYAADTVVQYYFNDNSRGIDPFVDVIYKNQPQAYIRTMDDDAGAMSAWYVLTACGITPACVGWPVYYLNVPLFEKITFHWPGAKKMVVHTKNFSPENRYIRRVLLNNKILNRNYLTHEEITAGGNLVIEAAAVPVKSGAVSNKWISSME